MFTKKDVIDKLIEKTKKGELNWTKDKRLPFPYKEIDLEIYVYADGSIYTENEIYIGNSLELDTAVSQWMNRKIERDALDDLWSKLKGDRED